MTLNEAIAMSECTQDVLDDLNELYSKYAETIERYNTCPTVVSKYTNKQLYLKRLMVYIENADFTVMYSEQKETKIC